MEQKELAIIVGLVVVVAALGGGLGYVLLQPAPSELQDKSLDIKLWWPIEHYGSTEPDIANILKDNIEATGRISVTLDSVDWATYVDQFSNGQMGMFLLGWYPDFFDADNYIQPFLSTGGAKSLGSMYSDPLMDLAILQERVSFGDERTAIFAEIQKKLAEDALYIPLFQGNQHVVYQDDVTGVLMEPVRSFHYDQLAKPGETTVIVGTTDSVVSLDPADAYDYFSVQMIEHMFETLLSYTPGTADLVPKLATAVPTVANGGISTSGLEYTYNIRSGITFQDGEPLDAAAVAFSINRARTIDGDPGFLLDIIDSVTATGSMQVKITLSNPFTAFNALMAFTVSAIVSPDAYTAIDFRPGIDANVPVGTGPYELLSGDYVANQRVTLTKNADYWGTPGVSDKVQVNLVGDATALKTQIEAGEIHVAFRTLNPDDLLDLEDRQTALDLVVEIGTSPFIRYIVFNVQIPPFDNVWVRKTIAAAVDRDTIVSQVFLDLAFPLYSMIADIFPEHTDAFKDVYGTGPDVTMANEFLDEYFTSIEEGLGQTVFADRILLAREAS